MAEFNNINLAQIYGAADEAKARQLQNQVIQNQFARQQKQDSEDDAVKGAYSFDAAGKLDETATGSNLARVSPQKYYEFQTAISKRDQDAAKMKREDNTAKLSDASSILKLQGESAKNILADPTLKTALYNVQQFGQLTGQDVTGELDIVNQIGENPDGLRKYAAGHALTAEQMLPKTQMQDTGGASNVLSIDPLTSKPTVTASTNKTATPDAVMSNNRAMYEGALNRNLTMRGQNMTDARSREKNANDVTYGKAPDQ